MSRRTVGLISGCILMLSCFGSVNANFISTTFSGTVDGEIAAFATQYSGGTSGILTLSNIPIGATILSATLSGHNWDNLSANLSADFNGINLGSVGASSTDGNLAYYEWDVTSLVTGSGSYLASYSGATNSYGLALSVVFSDPSLDNSIVVLNKGAKEVYFGDNDQTIHNSVAGPSELWVYTQADNQMGQTNETISLNGTIVGGPIDNNLGPYASLFHIDNLTSTSGNNLVEIYSPADNFGWHLSMLKTNIASVPEPSIIVMLLIGLIPFCRFLRRKNIV